MPKIIFLLTLWCWAIMRKWFWKHLKSLNWFSINGPGGNFQIIFVMWLGMVFLKENYYFILKKITPSSQNWKFLENCNFILKSFVHFLKIFVSLIFILSHDKRCWNLWHNFNLIDIWVWMLIPTTIGNLFGGNLSYTCSSRSLLKQIPISTKQHPP